MRSPSYLLPMFGLPLLAWLLLALLWGSEWMLTAWLPAEPPLLSLSLRYAAASLVLLPWALRGQRVQMPRRDLLSVALVGAGLLALPQILLVVSMHGISPAWSLLALGAVPVLLAIGGQGQISTAVCGFGGVLLLLANNLTIHPAQLPWLLCPLAAATILAFTLTRAAAMREQLAGRSLGAALFVQVTVAAALTAAAAAVIERQPLAWSAGQAVGLAVGALLATVAAYVVFYWLLLRAGPARMAMLQWVQLLVAIAESALLAATRPGWEFLAGALLIAIALRRAWMFPEAEQGVMLQITRL
jgi:drug/metabolite transporter (DMT)-like permease